MPMAAQTQAQARSDAGAKVVVACKLPAGLVMRGYSSRKERETILGGGTREFDTFRWTGDEAVIHGTAVPIGQTPKCRMVAGFALTPNVSKDLYENWLSHNKDGRLVQQGLIFAYERPGDTEAEASTNKDAITGFESIDPEAPWKKVRGIVKADVK